jgi:sulfur relay (sulfurtransferase) DsrC/TusE family protein
MILGLDISSTCTGVAFLKDDGKLYHFSFIDTNKRKNKANAEQFQDLFDIVDEIVQYFRNFYLIHPTAPKITEIHIEEPLKKFTPGFSSMETLSTLLKVNYAVSFELFKLFGLKPIYHDPRSAAKLAGIKLAKGDDKKQVVFEKMREKYKEFNDAIPPKLPKKHPYLDASDAILIATAGYESRKST